MAKKVYAEFANYGCALCEDGRIPIGRVVTVSRAGKSESSHRSLPAYVDGGKVFLNRSEAKWGPNAHSDKQDVVKDGGVCKECLRNPIVQKLLHIGQLVFQAY